MADVLHVKTADFEQEVIKSEVPVLVDFWASWCGPCRMVGPIIDEIAKERDGKLKVCKVDVDAETEIARKYGVMSIPTLIVFKDGAVADTMVGAQPKPGLDRFVEKYV